jgi:hypothetical protein
MPTTRRHLQLNNACSGAMVRCALTWRQLDQELKVVRRLKWVALRASLRHASALSQ